MLRRSRSQRLLRGIQRSQAPLRTRAINCLRASERGVQRAVAVQAVSEHLYASLLSGVTNATSRIRCYSFYPWFVRAFDKLVVRKSVDELVRLFGVLSAVADCGPDPSGWPRK